MEALRKQRGVVKGTITRIKNWVVQNIDLLSDHEYFETRLQALDVAYDNFCNIQQKIEEQVEDVSDSDERGLVEDQYLTLSAQLKKKINSLTVKNVINSANPANLAQSSTSSNITRPQLNIPIFSGDITTWHGFYELFKNFIEDDSKLTKIEKLIYLKSYLKGEALSLICNLQLTSDNFDVALKTLKDRYDNELNIIYAYIKNLIDAPSLSKNKSMSLRDLITSFKQNIEGLKNLRVNVEQWDLILIYIFSQKLDARTRTAFDYELGINSRPTLTLFFEFLEKRCIIFERSTIPDIGVDLKSLKVNHRVHLSHNHSEVYKEHVAPSSAQTNVFKCTFCNIVGHKIYKCQKFCALPRNEKYNAIKSKRLCYNCLAPNHTTYNCSSRGCSVCNQKHHTLLHHDANRPQVQPSTHPNQSSSIPPSNNSEENLNNSIDNPRYHRFSQQNCVSSQQFSRTRQGNSNNNL